ncbi:MAG: isocitrate lyase/phosphoenolpyruvate mutase family protein [Dehalococcoidia bacterium]|nr:isocitrate lyase/phosphoenolpyruvate mutase family protein [Dehalococcoidia bacterium]
MADAGRLDQLVAKVATFRALHEGPGMLVMANAWDAASAQRFEAAGFPAVATTSGGVAISLGYADHEQAPADEMLAAAERIAASVSLPVTVDLEAGYGLPPEEVARRVVQADAVGLNLEDTDHRGGSGLAPAEAQAERLAAVKAAARALGVDLFLNARVDVFIRREGDLDAQVAEGTRRGRLYREAGADAVYPILLSDPAAIRAMVQACEMVNVTVRRGGPLSLQAAAAAGARRATYATSLFRDTMGALDTIAAEIRAEVPGLD